MIFSVNKIDGLNRSDEKKLPARLKRAGSLQRPCVFITPAERPATAGLDPADRLHGTNQIIRSGSASIRNTARPTTAHRNPTAMINPAMTGERTDTGNASDTKASTTSPALTRNRKKPAMQASRFFPVFAIGPGATPRRLP